MGREADQILRSCVHCGFCTAACPTYRLLGDERDSPRGRIYLIKALLEDRGHGSPPGPATRLHLDRCLGCRACETACPSGVEYGRLLDIGRERLESSVPRSWRSQFVRWAMRKTLPHPKRWAPLVRLARALRPRLPASLRSYLPVSSAVRPWPAQPHPRRMLVLEGCVQPVLAPGVNAAAARVLDRLGIHALPGSGCCGALSYHLGASAEALGLMRRNVDAWWPAIEAGVEAVLATASGCGAMIKEYGRLLGSETDYAARAKHIADLTRDPCEVLGAEDLGVAPTAGRRVAFHAPCSLQHALNLGGITESILQRAGFELTTVKDAHLCCGSAGTYSLLQPALARALRKEKLKNLEAGQPALIATANIGCYYYLQLRSAVPVRHWIELFDPMQGD